MVPVGYMRACGHANWCFIVWFSSYGVGVLLPKKWIGVFFCFLMLLSVLSGLFSFHGTTSIFLFSFLVSLSSSAIYSFLRISRLSGAALLAYCYHSFLKNGRQKKKKINKTSSSLELFFSFSCHGYCLSRVFFCLARTHTSTPLIDCVAAYN